MRYLRKNDVDQPQETATHTIAPPAPLNFKNPEEWPKWIRRFERYRISTELNEKDEVLQINIMIYCMGDEADAIVKSFTFAESDEKKCAKNRSQHPRNCKQGRAVYIGSNDDSPMITDNDCLSSVYYPDDDNGRTDDDEDEFQSIENIEENLSTSRSKQAIF